MLFTKLFVFIVFATTYSKRFFYRATDLHLHEVSLVFERQNAEFSRIVYD
jgi:hypothetical protein